jgi:hypothetical protein
MSVPTAIDFGWAPDDGRQPQHPRIQPPTRATAISAVGQWRPDDRRALNAPMIATNPSPPCKGFPIHRVSSPPLGLPFRPRQRSSMPRTDIRISPDPSPRRRRQDGSKPAQPPTQAATAKMPMILSRSIVGPSTRGYQNYTWPRRVNSLIRIVFDLPHRLGPRRDLVAGVCGWSAHPAAPGNPRRRSEKSEQAGLFR